MNETPSNAARHPPWNPIYIHQGIPSPRARHRKEQTNKRKKTKTRRDETRRDNGLPSLCPLEDYTSHETSCKRQTAHNRNAHEPLLGHLLVNQRSQAGSLHVRRLLVEEEIVVASGLAVVPELVVPESQIVEAFSSTFGGGTEDFREQTDTFLLVVAGVRFDQALHSESVSDCSGIIRLLTVRKP